MATTLNEIAMSSDVCIEIREDLIPVREEVKGACEILGLDPLYVANEGKLIAIVSAEIADQIILRMKENPNGQQACIIGEVKAEPQGIVSMTTAFGGTRIVDMLAANSFREFAKYLCSSFIQNKLLLRLATRLARHPRQNGQGASLND